MVEAVEKCELCRFPCKSEDYKQFCKFIPKNDLLAPDVYFKDPNNRKHESTSRMCVVCKDWVSHSKTHWKKEKEGWISLCRECAKTALNIDEMLRG